MTAAQKTAKDKFKKAIAYRTKTGVSLKEAFAHIYGKKIGAVKKKTAVKKAAPKKKKAAKKTTVKKVNSVTTVSGIKKRNTKKVSSLHKDTKSHNVNIRVVSGIGKISNEFISQLKGANDKLIKWQKVLSLLEMQKSTAPKGFKLVVATDIKKVKNAIKEQKIHIRELKKNIK
jgi:aconitate hydratase